MNQILYSFVTYYIGLISLQSLKVSHYFGQYCAFYTLFLTAFWSFYAFWYSTINLLRTWVVFLYSFPTMTLCLDCQKIVYLVVESKSEVHILLYTVVDRLDWVPDKIHRFIEKISWKISIGYIIYLCLTCFV